MSYLWRMRHIGALSLLVMVPAFTAPMPDAMALFRDEIVDAARKIGWKGPELSEETRFAVAASGLSWQPIRDGTPLLTREKKATRYADAESRRVGFLSARRAQEPKVAFAFALSLVLDPPEDDPQIWTAAFDYLRDYRADFDKALVGILEAPEKLPLLPAYPYAAADALVYRASTRLLPLFLTLADSSDRYLRSRAVASIGIVGYRARQDGSNAISGLLVTPHEVSVSAVLRSMMDEAIHRAVEDKNYHVRAAAALALGLEGDAADLPLLEKLAKDHVYLVFPAGGKNTKRIVFPVRAQAVASLERFGRHVEDGGGVFSGKALKQATRGGKDVTNDHGDIRRDRASRVRFCAGEW